MHAQEEARRMKHSAVGCDHLLMALLVIGEGNAYKSLSKCDVGLEVLRTAVGKRHKKGSKASPKELPFDSDAKVALARAFREALYARQKTISSEHLLLGLLCVQSDAGNAATSALADLNVNSQALRQSIWYGIVRDDSSEVDDGSGMPHGYAKWLLKKCPQILMFAIAEAVKLKQEKLGPEVLLLALLGAGGSVIRVLEDFNVTYDEIYARMETLLECGSGYIDIEFRITPSAKKLLQEASDEAVNLGHDTLNARHLLLGFTHEQDGVAWQVLKEKGVDFVALRESVLALFEESK